MRIEVFVDSNSKRLAGISECAAGKSFVILSMFVTVMIYQEVVDGIQWHECASLQVFGYNKPKGRGRCEFSVAAKRRQGQTRRFGDPNMENKSDNLT